MLDIRVNNQVKFEPLETSVPATEEESVILAEKLTQVAIPLEVLLQALNIAKYDKAAAFRYADNHLNKTRKKPRKSKWVVIKASSNSEMKGYKNNDYC
ncbi:hypothetical protein H6G90_34295 [Nostoc sp. FACHB-145]|nr:hypothetical protein [Nostoc sp. FACHB-145]